MFQLRLRINQTQVRLEKKTGETERLERKLHSCAVCFQSKKPQREKNQFVFTNLCFAGPRSAGAAVGGDVRAHRGPGPSPETAAAEHRPAAAHLPAGQADPGAGAQIGWTLDI